MAIDTDENTGSGTDSASAILSAAAVESTASDAAPMSGAVPLTDTLLESLIHENLDWLRGWVGARLRGSRAHDADDLCQEILLRAVRGARKLRNPECFPAWLYRIAGNTLRDYLRRRKVRVWETVGIDVEPMAPGGFDSTVDRKEEVERTVRAVLDLPRRYREPMVLRHVKDVSYAEIGKILGITENAVQVRIFRARKMLRRMLDETSGATPAMKESE